MGSSLPGESGEYILESRTTIIRVVADLRHAGDIESHLASVCSSQVVRDKVVRQCTAVDHGMRWCAHLSLGLEAMVVMKSCIGGGIVIGGRKQPLHRLKGGLSTQVSGDRGFDRPDTTTTDGNTILSAHCDKGASSQSPFQSYARFISLHVK